LRLVRQPAVIDFWRCGIGALGPPAGRRELRRSLYWMWSKHLAGGYYDHPPGGRAGDPPGTMIARDTESACGLVSILAGAAMSWAVYRTARDPVRRGARGGDRCHAAQRYLDGGGRHPDRHARMRPAAPPFFLFVWRKYWRPSAARGGSRPAPRRRSIMSKYTALLFDRRFDWLGERSKAAALVISPWPYSAQRSAAYFSRWIFCECDHHWVSFIKQLGRARVAEFKAGVHPPN